jgi:hypothetical protein
MNHVTADQFGRIPEGMKWCPRCNGYGSSLKEASGRCTHCGGSGLVWADRDRPVAATASPPRRASEQPACRCQPPGEPEGLATRAARKSRHDSGLNRRPP